MAPTAVVDLHGKPTLNIVSTKEIASSVMTTEIPETTSLTHHGPTQSRTTSPNDYRSEATRPIISDINPGPTPSTSWTHTSVPSPALSRSQSSSYARASLSTFLYSAPVHSISDSGSIILNISTPSNTHALGAASKIDYEFPYLPIGFRVALFICIGLGLLWALVVYWVNFPPSFFTTQPSSRIGKVSKKRRWNKDVWYMNWIPGCERNNQKNKKKPVDKPSKYAPVPTSASSTSTLDSSMLVLGSTMSLPLRRMNNMYAHSANNGSVIDLRNRKPTLHSSPAPSQLLQTPAFLQRSPCPDPDIQGNSMHMKTHARSASTPSLTSGVAKPLPISNYHPSPRSPENPFLPTPHLRPKSSAEWLRDREVFLAQCSARSSSPSTAPDMDPNCSVSLLHLRDMEFVEAQVADACYKHNSPVGYGRYLERGICDCEKVHKKRDSWLDRVDYPNGDKSGWQGCEMHG